jgi:hypothetical protein
MEKWRHVVMETWRDEHGILINIKKSNGNGSSGDFS